MRVGRSVGRMLLLELGCIIERCGVYLLLIEMVAPKNVFGGLKMKICKYCGSKMADSDRKCTSCGAEEFYQIAEDNGSEVNAATKKISISLARLLRTAPKKIKMMVAAVCVLLVLLLGLNIMQYFRPDKGPVQDSQVAQLGFKDIGELATQAAYYTEIISDKDYRKFFNTDINVPGTKRWIIVSFNGTIKAGIDFAQIEYKIDDERKAINVSLPEVKILSNEVDHESIKVWYEQLNVLNPSSIMTSNELFKKIEEDGEKHSVENGLLENAIQNARVLIENTCKAVFPGYTVLFE